MTNLNNRIYNELNDWKHAESYLTEFSLVEKKKIKVLDTILIAVSLIGIAGWFRFEEFKIFWTVILVLAQLIRIIQKLFITSTADLFNIKNSISFYSQNILDLENLYYDFHNKRYNFKTIESKLNVLREKERNLFGKQTFDKLKEIRKLNIIAERNTDIYLKKVINNISHER